MLPEKNGPPAVASRNGPDPYNDGKLRPNGAAIADAGGINIAPGANRQSRERRLLHVRLHVFTGRDPLARSRPFHLTEDDLEELVALCDQLHRSAGR